MKEKFSEIMPWISDIIFNFYKLLALRMIQTKIQWIFWLNFFQTSNLTFVASEINQQQPKVLEWNSAEEKLKGFFPLKYAILSFGKCLNN